LDSALAGKKLGWNPATPWRSILEEIACHAEENPHWLDLTAG
jgi:CDP-paratose 2-epimerase